VEENGAGYSYPGRFSAFFRDRYSTPAVYRWRIHPGENGKKERVYIGQAEDLVTQIQRVLTPPRTGKGGQTNRRLKKLFDAAVSTGRLVFLDIADFEKFELNGVEFSNRDLTDSFKRLTLENLLLCIAQAEGHPLLNSAVERADEARARLAKLKPRELRQLLREHEMRSAKHGEAQ